MSDENHYSAFHFLSPHSTNPQFTPDWGPHPAGTRETVTFFIDGTEVDKIKGTWQEDGTILLDRPMDGGKLAGYLLGPIYIEDVRIRDRSQGKAKRQPERRKKQQNDAAECHQRQCERILQRGDYAGSRVAATRKAQEEGLDFVPYRYYYKNSRVLVRRHLLQDDFDGTYERLCAYLGESPAIVLEEEDFIHFREKDGK